ncbi:MAG: hypothetical protein HY000_06180 [Planctomycetes bacterium]|nr:hypothetical protein [Planctomycetota bacterium]
MVTLQNPTRNPIYYTLNGERQIGILPRQQVTLRGVGYADIKFDRGLGDGSIYAYRLASGKTYVFGWKEIDLPEIGTANVLNLYSK